MTVTLEPTTETGPAIGDRPLGPTASGGSTRDLATVAVVGFVLSFAQSLRGAARGYSYDESVTVGFFVDSTFLAGFTGQRVANNHPLFSVLEQAVWSVGAHSELAMRFLPAGCTAATVALVAWWTGRRWGRLAAISAGLVLLSNPIFVSYGQQARGYSLLVLAATVSTICFLDIEIDHVSDRAANAGALYVAAAAVGLATHLYMLPILAGHGLFVVTRRHLSLVWFRRWAIVAAAGALAYMNAMPQRRPGSFRPELPWETTQAVLSGTAISIVILGLVSAAALWAHRRHWALVAGPLTFCAFIWLVAQPLDFYARFFVWVVPAVAVAAGWAVARRPLTLVAVAIAAAFAWPIAAPEDHGIRETATVLEAAQAEGRAVCAIGSEALAAYTRTVPEFRSDRTCDVVAAIGSWQPAGFADMVAQSSRTEEISWVTIYFTRG